MEIGQDKKQVLGNFHGEMARRLKAGRHRKQKALVGIIIALALLWYAIQPIGLDVWHQLALFAGVIGLLLITESPAYQLADEMDILEKKVVERLKEIEKKADTFCGIYECFKWPFGNNLFNSRLSHPQWRAASYD